MPTPRIVGFFEWLVFGTLAFYLVGTLEYFTLGTPIIPGIVIGFAAVITLLLGYGPDLVVAFTIVKYFLAFVPVAFIMLVIIYEIPALAPTPPRFAPRLNPRPLL